MCVVNPAVRTSRKPTIDEEEVQRLASQFGEPLRRTYDVQAAGTTLEQRWRTDSDRRAEVIFAIQGPGKGIWLHTKHNYPHPIFRLPSGGIDWDESVLDALHREIDEETGLSTITVERFVALLHYRFHRGPSVVHFASYLFLVQNLGSKLENHSNAEVAEFRAVLPCQIPQAAADLRNILGERRAWGHWRALAHDVLHEMMKK
ncbi:MAG: NUDIX hydrolase [Caldilineaceae bacterium]